ncbi:MAG: hypothetical protein JWQ98_1867 [Chlorobi bacterium]|nr:hypothetical protein [Chlorobiota bacterium]
MDQIGGLIGQYVNGGGATTREEARDHYDQIAGAVPEGVLGSVIGPALSELGSDQVRERVYNSATEMTPQQRGGLLGSLLGGLSSSGIDLSSLLGKLGISHNVADNPETASPEDVAKVAAHAQENNPGVFQQAMGFYAKHPTLVKILGTMAIASIAKRLSSATA